MRDVLPLPLPQGTHASPASNAAQRVLRRHLLEDLRVALRQHGVDDATGEGGWEGAAEERQEPLAGVQDRRNSVLLLTHKLQQSTLQWQQGSVEC